MRPPPSRASADRGRLRAALGAGLSLSLAFVLSACVGGSVTTLTSPPTTDATLTLTIQRSPLGPILATGRGATLYDFGPDSSIRSACLNAGCVYQWPPLDVTGVVRVGAGVKGGLVGRLSRPDGSTQLSYGGHPLYTYIRDVKPGLVTGQAIDQDGGPWYVLDPAGIPIHTPFTVNG
jgi:predicted lipoprotein with Yx(FWY)xxD motif